MCLSVQEIGMKISIAIVCCRPRSWRGSACLCRRLQRPRSYRRHHCRRRRWAACWAGLLTNGNGVGIVGGALLGGLAGNAISRDMDCEDRPYAARSYDDSFHGPVGRRYEWRRGPNRGYIVTNREYYRGPRLCRDFTQVVYRRGREFDRDGTACQRRDGEWEFL